MEEAKVDDQSPLNVGPILTQPDNLMEKAIVTGVTFNFVLSIRQMDRQIDMQLEKQVNRW